ncbi:MAG: diheme cytochrome c [Deltaproteobacteria bacterium]|nr:diheme cytochrome c [Deltaproteobacteria bacterium]
MNVYKRSIAVLISTALGFGLESAPAFADDDQNRRQNRRENRRNSPYGTDPKAALTSTTALLLYETECGSCHLAYPPGMLPGRSWVKLLDELADHFGQNAELDSDSRAKLERWLLDNAAEGDTHPLSKKVVRSSRGSTPLRLSDLRFIAHEHGELRGEVFARSSVRSVANCGACHLGAERWSFRERELRIPK